jgi:hypothetical protein
MLWLSCMQPIPFDGHGHLFSAIGHCPHNTGVAPHQNQRLRWAPPPKLLEVYTVTVITFRSSTHTYHSFHWERKSLLH